MSASMKWRHLGYLQLFKGYITFTVTAEMEVSQQEEMANPQGMKIFAVEGHGLLEDFVFFRTPRGAIVATRVCSESFIHPL